MKILIVGGCGLLGATSALRLAVRGHAVTLAGRNPPLPDSPIARFAFERFDFLSDMERAPALLDGFDAMIFTAGQDPKMIPPDPRDPHAYIDRASAAGRLLLHANGVMVPRLFAAARDAGVEVAINVGTFYPQVIPEALAANAYMQSRKDADDGLRALSRPGFRAMSVNPSWVMGAIPAMRFPLWENYIRYAADVPAQSAFAPPGGTNIISLDIVADAVEGALERGKGGHSYLLGDQNVTFQQLLGAFFAGFGRPVPPIIDKPHPVIVDAAIRRGQTMWYDPDPADVALLRWRRDDGLRAISEEMVPAFQARRVAAAPQDSNGR
jgi:dihydroflavonol-4-reductase